MAESEASPSGALSLECSTAYVRALVQHHLQGFDLVFSAGPYCRSAFHLRRLFNQSQAFPFDWWVTPASSLQRMLHPDYRFELTAADVHLTQAAQVVFNSRDLILHLHDFERTAGLSSANSVSRTHLSRSFSGVSMRTVWIVA